VLRGGEVNEINELKRSGLTISQISSLTGNSRPTIRKYLAQASTPRYGPRQPRPTILDAYKPFLQERLAAGVWNAVVLHRELKERGYEGGYTVVKDFLRPQRREAQSVAVRRFETAPGHQAQVDWADLGDLTQEDGLRHKLYGFVMTLGYSRAMFCDIALNQKLPAFVRMHEAAFAYLGGVPREILYDNTKTVILKTLTEGVDGRGEVKLNPAFADFARYWGFTIRLCRPYRPQTKGKVENGIGYVRKNFLCGRDAHGLQDLSGQMRVWTGDVANVRLHGSTHRLVSEAWAEEKPHLAPTANRRAYPLVVETLRRVTRDAYVCYHNSRYSVPWQSAGKEVLVREIGAQIEIVRDNQVLACHTRSLLPHQIVTVSTHHVGIPLGGNKSGKARLSLTVRAPQVEVRSLAVYEVLADLAEREVA
jgi:transposase